jgi:hypothetical protein
MAVKYFENKESGMHDVISLASAVGSVRTTKEAKEALGVIRNAIMDADWDSYSDDREPTYQGDKYTGDMHWLYTRMYCVLGHALLGKRKYRELHLSLQTIRKEMEADK